MSPIFLRQVNTHYCWMSITINTHSCIGESRSLAEGKLCVTHLIHTLVYTSVILIHGCNTRSWVWYTFMSMILIQHTLLHTRVCVCCDAHSWVWCSFMRVMLIQHTLLYTRVRVYCEIHSCDAHSPACHVHATHIHVALQKRLIMIFWRSVLIIDTPYQK